MASVNTIYYQAMRCTMCLLIILLSVAMAHAQNQQPGLPLINHYSPETYKADGTIYSIAQDQRGILYFGTHGGIVEYDGTDWNYIIIPNKSIVFSLFTASDGTIYVGGQNDFGRLVTDLAGNTYYESLLQQQESSSKASMTVHRIHELEGAIFFTTNAGLFVWENNSLTRYDHHGGLHISFIINGEYWVRKTGIGLMRWDGKDLQKVPGSEIFANRRIYMMHPVSKDSTIISTREDGFFVMTAAGFSRLNTLNCQNLHRHRIYSYSPYGKDKLILGTLDAGLIITDYQLNPIRKLSTGTGLNDNIIFTIFTDRQDNIWLGYGSDKGVSQILLNSPFTVFDDRHNIRGPVFSTVLQDKRLFIGSTPGLYQREWQSNTSIGKDFELTPGLEVQTIDLLPLEQGCLLVAHTEGVSTYCDNKVRRIITGSYTGDLLQLRDFPEYVLASHRNGIRLLNNESGVWEDKGMISGFEESSTVEGWSLSEDQNGNIWIPTAENGIYRFGLNTDQKAFVNKKQFTDDHGLPSKSNNRMAMVQGKQVVITEKGIYAYDSNADRFFADQRFEEVNRRQTFVRSLSEGPNGDLWFWGISQYQSYSRNPNYRPQYEAGHLIWDPISKVYHLNPESLHSLSKYFFASLPQIFPVAENSVVINTGGGFIHYDPTMGVPQNQDFAAMVRRVETISDQDSTIYGGGGMGSNEKNSALNLPFSRNALRFTVTAPSYEEPKELEFQYLLDGFDQNWSAWTNKNEKEYTNLREGNYTFHVRARNVHHQISAGALYHFTVHPPWYRTTTAYVIGFFLLLLIVYGLVTLNTRRLVREKTALETMVRERTAEVQQQNHDLEIQKQEIARQKESIAVQNEELIELNSEKNHLIGVVAHDLRSPLNHIKGLGSLLSILSDNLTKEQKQYVAEIINSADRLHEMISKILDIDAIEQKKVNLRLTEVNVDTTITRIVNQFEPDAGKKRIKLNYSQRGEASPYKLDEQYFTQVMENLISNALKFSEFDKAIEVDAHFQNDYVTICVKDDGPGFRPEELGKLFGKFQRLSARPTNGENSVGLGLSIVKKYVEVMNGSVWCESEHKNGASFFIRFPRSAQEEAK